MNVAYFLTPKKDTAYLYDDYTLRQALEKMRAHGYTRIPVISHDGKYINVVGEGDFLWYMLFGKLIAGIIAAYVALYGWDKLNEIVHKYKK